MKLQAEENEEKKFHKLVEVRDEVHNELEEILKGSALGSLISMTINPFSNDYKTNDFGFPSVLFATKINLMTLLH